MPKEIRVTIDGKYYEKSNGAAQKFIDYLDSLPYGKCVTKEHLAKKFNYRQPKAIYSVFNKIGISNILESYRFQYNPTLSLFGNKKTIRDLKNGTLQV